MVGELLDALTVADAGVVVLVNGLGGTGDLELLHVLAEVQRVLAERDVTLRSAVSGTYVSALDMAGFSLTVTAVADEQWLTDWCAPHATTSLPSPVPADTTIAGEEAQSGTGEPSPWLRGLARDVADLREPLNDLDRRAGDGDIGTNLDNALQAAVRRGTGAGADLAADLKALGGAFSEDVGGSSGPLFGLVLARIAVQVAANSDGGPAAAAAQGLRDGVEAITRVGGARVGDRRWSTHCIRRGGKMTPPVANSTMRHWRRPCPVRLPRAPWSASGAGPVTSVNGRSAPPTRVHWRWWPC